MTQKKTVQPQITHDHAGHAHVNCPGHAPCRLCRIEVDHLSVSAGNQQLLHDVNLHIHCGELTALIGANGAGKTTTLDTIAGLLRSRGGDIVFQGESIAHKAPHLIVKDGLALVPEGRRVFAQMTVEENLEMGAFTRANSTVEPGLEKVYELFPRLKERRRQVAGTLSGGEQQMLAMGRALMSAPKLMMLDEPSMGLAPILVEQVFDIIQSLHKAGTTILLVEQNAQMALSIADRAYVLENGKVSLSGTGEELAKSEQVQKAYLGG